MEKGYVHVYTGNGKGKTTAALGLALRAVCAGKKVFFGQFAKGMDCSELKAGDLIKGLTIKQYGKDAFIIKPSKEDKEAAEEGLKEIESILKSDEFNIVILDEINIALHYNLLNIDNVIDILNKRNENIEVVLTGRNAPEKIIEFADLVTEMKEIKHYYNSGVDARIGIEK